MANPSEHLALLAALRWQIAMGADEAILETAAPRARKPAALQPERPAAAPEATPRAAETLQQGIVATLPKIQKQPVIGVVEHRRQKPKADIGDDFSTAKNPTRSSINTP
jgi:hypothetical protein